MAGAANPSALCNNGILPLEILVEILVRLPLKDVFRCQSVCKLWLSWIRDDPYFKRRFILVRVTEEAFYQEDQQLVCVQCTAGEMIRVSPRCSVLNDSELSLDFLPLVAGEDPNRRTLHLVLGSSKSLLLYLCWPCDGSEVYFVCNPLTKEWFKLPPSPNGHRVNVEVGFFCDPFYHVQDDDGSITLNDDPDFKVVRLLRCRDDEKGGVMVMDVEIFTSRTEHWTTVTMRSPIQGISKGFPKFAIPYNGRLYWMPDQSEILVYDPSDNEILLERIDPPNGVLIVGNYSFDFPDDYMPWFLAPFRGLSYCQDSLWVGQVWGSQLKVYTVINGDCCLTHHVHNLDEFHFSPSLAKWTLDEAHGLKFVTMHPSDPMIAYLSMQYTFLECNFGDKTLKVVAEYLREDQQPLIYGEWFNVLVISLPIWPTPLPAPPAA